MAYNYAYLWMKLPDLNPADSVPDSFPDCKIQNSTEINRTWNEYFRICRHPYYLTGHYPNGINRLTDVTQEEAQRFIDYFGEDKICEQPTEDENDNTCIRT